MIDYIQVEEQCYEEICTNLIQTICESITKLNLKYSTYQGLFTLYEAQGLMDTLIHDNQELYYKIVEEVAQKTKCKYPDCTEILVRKPNQKGRPKLYCTSHAKVKHIENTIKSTNKKRLQKKMQKDLNKGYKKLFKSKDRGVND